MDINRSNMAALFATYSTAFSAGMQRGRPVPPELADVYLRLLDLAMVVPSAGATTIHAWLNQLPGFRLWAGDRQKKDLSSQKLEVTNRDWEDTVAVQRNDIEDDQFGLYAPMMESMGIEAGDDALWLDMAVDALLANGTWIDGKAFFLADRKYGANTIANTTASALSQTTLEAAVTAMCGFKGPEGNFLSPIPAVLVVGPSLRFTAWDLVKNEFVSAGASKGGAIQNRVRGVAALKVHPKLSGDYANRWYLLGVKGGIKPVAVQKRKEAVFTAKDSPTDDNVFFNKEFIYGADARGEAFLTLPHLAYGGLVAA